MNQLSIALVRFPFSNQIDYKIRPSLIISNKTFNNVHNYFLTCPVTSKKTLKKFALKIDKSKFSGELKTESFIRTDAIASIEKDLFLKEIGKITPEFFNKVKNKIIKNL